MLEDFPLSFSMVDLVSLKEISLLEDLHCKVLGTRRCYLGSTHIHVRLLQNGVFLLFYKENFAERTSSDHFQYLEVILCDLALHE